MLVGFGAGGATDTIARVYGQKLSELLKTPVIIDNKPGASQLLAIHALQQAEPDGHTLHIASASSLAEGPAVRSDLDYDPLKAFTHVGFIGTAPGIITLNLDFPARSVGELITYAKAHPGSISYASAGFGSDDHLVGE